MKLEAKARLLAGPAFSAEFLKAFCGALINNGEATLGSQLESISNKNLPTQLDYLLSALESSSRASNRVREEFPEESAAFWRLKAPAQAKLLTPVFMGI
jgi:hypothetical protein